MAFVKAPRVRAHFTDIYINICFRTYTAFVCQPAGWMRSSWDKPVPTSRSQMVPDSLQQRSWDKVKTRLFFLYFISEFEERCLNVLFRPFLLLRFKSVACLWIMKAFKTPVGVIKCIINIVWWTNWLIDAYLTVGWGEGIQRFDKCGFSTERICFKAQVMKWGDTVVVIASQ